MLYRNLFIIFISFFFICSSVFAEGNNKFGISLLQPTSRDIENAAKLINTNGDWGYVTLVVQENDRDVRKWQDIFNKLRTHHLIPIMRLATSPQGEVWRRPEEKDAKEWSEFLNRLNWVVKKRYIVLFNEPNHATEWGGAVDPEGYATIAETFAKTIKSSNGDYIIMLSGLDSAAPQLPDQYWDSGEFMSQMCKTKEKCDTLFSYIDAWASHAYPNPGFSGSVWDSGKKSIRGYEWELNLLQQLGVQKDLPVFITETGWQQQFLGEHVVAENMKTAYDVVWGKDDRVQAVTPFVFKYLAEPFIGFSWEKNDGFTAQYEAIKNLPKQVGFPEQRESGSLEVDLPSRLVVNSHYTISLYLKNTGQGIWDKESGYDMEIEAEGEAPFLALLPDLKNIEPEQETETFLAIKTFAKPQKYKLRFVLRKNGKALLKTNTKSVIIEPLPELSIKTSLFPKLLSNGDAFEVQFFNQKEELVFAKRGVAIRSGRASVDNIQNIVPGQKYRVVLLGYPYLPRQTIIVMNKAKNDATFKKLFPFDANGDGKWNWEDFKEVLTHPGFLIRFIPWNQL